uniref:Uncharacterized protein n=1 Tax=Aegilops tauschii subsp. strangulata TaxID=200361 RepID=A0A453MGN6_AEGTS
MYALSTLQTDQKLRLCDICGAFLSVYDNDRRLADHFGGKLHLGYMLIREKLKELQVHSCMPKVRVRWWERLNKVVFQILYTLKQRNLHHFVNTCILFLKIVWLFFFVVFLSLLSCKFEHLYQVLNVMSHFLL